MKLLRLSFLLTAWGALTGAVTRAADTVWMYAVQLTATVNASPARIELTWTSEPGTGGYTLQRKGVSDAKWGAAIELSGDAGGFVDEDVELGRTYEYKVVRHFERYNAYGYIAVGINAALADAPGRVILVVEQSIVEPLSREIARLQDDLTGDGWQVVRREVARDASPVDVKVAIKAEYDADRERVKAVFLLGAIPIVRSGNLNVDGHQRRPMPADVFYGDMDGEWTDEDGDGVYDQNLLPSDVELQVGRVDFSNLASGVPELRDFAYPGEVELLQRYLNKNHAFRHTLTRPAVRALVGDQFGNANGQAYAANGFRNFAPLIGPGNITLVDTHPSTAPGDRWMAQLAKRDYLWVYGAGAGADFAVNGLGWHGEFDGAWSNDFLEQKARGTFYLLFGSWFGDWSQPGNLLRSALAAPDYGLAAVWAGRPHIFYYHMGVGESIGHGIRISQNNDGVRYQNQSQRQVRAIHLALMGDPTLRMHQLAPATTVAAKGEGSAVTVTWGASRDPVVGYHVYRAGSMAGPFARLTGAPVAGTQFVDTQRTADGAIYMVRAVTLHAGPSGSFYHASQGAFAMVGAAAALSAPDSSSGNATPTDGG